MSGEFFYLFVRPVQAAVSYLFVLGLGGKILACPDSALPLH